MMPYNYSNYSNGQNMQYQQGYQQQPMNYQGYQQQQPVFQQQMMQQPVYQNQQVQQQQNQQNTRPQNSPIIQWIKGGENAVNEYPMAPGTSMIFMDDNDNPPVMYIKTVDSLGRMQELEIYDCIRRQRGNASYAQAPQQQVQQPQQQQVQQPQIDLSQFVKKDDLESMVKKYVNKALE